MWAPEIDLGSILEGLFVFVALVFGGGTAAASLLRARGLMWTWAMLGLPVALVVWHASLMLGMVVGFGCLQATMLGARWHARDIAAGADLAADARDRLGVIEQCLRLLRKHFDVGRPKGWIARAGLEVGLDAKDRPVYIPIGDGSGAHALVVGATGSGKTVTQAWVAARLIEAGCGAVVIDPKGDRLLYSQLQCAATKAGRPLLVWSPEGPTAYNPYAHGSASEIADKALAGETFTEPHYLRQAQRYLGHAIRTMHAANIAVTPVSLMAHLDPRQLEVTARKLDEQDAQTVQAYLDSLSDRQQRDLAGVRDRLSILAESEASPWLDPDGRTPVLDLREAVAQSAVLYFRLDSDRRMLLSQMIAAAIVSDLITLTADLQDHPTPTVVMIDEFAAIAGEHINRLFARGRSAGLSLILATQELADLTRVTDTLRDQVLGNIETLIAHRQNVPESADLIAAVAGTRATWIATQQTSQHRILGQKLTGQGSLRRGHEYEIHPSHIKRLPTGTAAVITPARAQAPTIARIHHPAEADWSLRA